MILRVYQKGINIPHIKTNIIQFSGTIDIIILITRKLLFKNSNIKYQMNYVLHIYRALHNGFISVWMFLFYYFLSMNRFMCVK